MRLESVYVTIPLGFFTFAFVSPKFGVHLPCLYIKGAPKHFLQHSTLLLGATSILCILSRTSFGSFLSASLYSLSKTSETEKNQSYSRLFKKHCTMHATIPIKCFWWFYIVTKLSSLTRCWFFFFKMHLLRGPEKHLHKMVWHHTSQWMPIASFTVPFACSQCTSPITSHKGLTLSSNKWRQDRRDQERVGNQMFR